MKVFVYFGISLAKTGVFIDIYTYLQLSFSIHVYPIRCNLIVISVDYSSIARGKQRGRFASNNHC